MVRTEADHRVQLKRVAQLERDIARGRPSAPVLELTHVDRSTGTEFERILQRLFEANGYKADLTPLNDKGADLVLQKSGERTVVQAKRYARPVGIGAIQEAVTAKRVYNCSHAMVVTNCTFTRQAREVAKDNDVELWDRERLREGLERASLASLE